MRPFFLYLKPSVREKETTTQPSKQPNPQSQKKQQSKQGRKPSREASHESRTREENERTKGKILQEIATSL